MKLKFERDIPAFKGKMWRERLALLALARRRDRSIIWLEILIGLATFPPSFLLSRWLAFKFFPHFLLAALIFIYMILAAPVYPFLRALIIYPRINRALASGVQ